MKSRNKTEDRVIADRKRIYEMIDASWELAAKKGKHPIENGCNCIICVNKRKRLMETPKNKWKFKL